MPKKTVGCAVETAIEIIGGRWKVLILQELFGGVRRFSELHRALAGVSHRTLTQQLRELEGHGISAARSIGRCRPRWSTP